MHIENKWKRYAVGHHLSDYSGDGAELFDALMAEENDEKLCEVLEARGGLVWHTYENDDVVDVVTCIRDMAVSLQLTALGDLYEGA